MDEFPFCLPAVRALDRLDIGAPVTIFVGENGSGKSTLIEAIAVAAGFNAEGGSKNFNFETRRTDSELRDHLKIARGTSREENGFFLRAETFYNVSSQIDDLGVEDHYGGASLHTVSHGESFLALVANRFWPRSLYIMDEPEAALSPQGQITLIAHLLRLVRQKDCQIIMATHSPILMAFPDAVIYQITADGIEKVALEETEHFRLYKGFISSPERVIKRLTSTDGS